MIVSRGGWRGFDDMFALVAGRFAQADSRRRARMYLLGNTKGGKDIPNRVSQRWPASETRYGECASPQPQATVPAPQKPPARRQHDGGDQNREAQVQQIMVRAG